MESETVGILVNPSNCGVAPNTEYREFVEFLLRHARRELRDRAHRPLEGGTDLCGEFGQLHVCLGCELFSGSSFLRVGAPFRVQGS